MVYISASQVVPASGVTASVAWVGVIGTLAGAIVAYLATLSTELIRHRRQRKQRLSAAAVELLAACRMSIEAVEYLRSLRPGSYIVSRSLRLLSKALNNYVRSIDDLPKWLDEEEVPQVSDRKESLNRSLLVGAKRKLIRSSRSAVLPKARRKRMAVIRRRLDKAIDVGLPLMVVLTVLAESMDELIEFNSVVPQAREDYAQLHSYMKEVHHAWTEVQLCGITEVTSAANELVNKLIWCVNSLKKELAKNEWKAAREELAHLESTFSEMVLQRS